MNRKLALMELPERAQEAEGAGHPDAVRFPSRSMAFLPDALGR